LIVPVFGFANAGVPLGDVGLEEVLSPLPLSIALALFFGKQVGVFASVRVAVALGWGQRPSGATWPQIYGVSMLCGVGFTMSLFIGGLAFAEPETLDAVKVGVLGGSAVSAVAGFAVLWLFGGKQNPARNRVSA